MLPLHAAFLLFRPIPARLFLRHYIAAAGDLHSVRGSMALSRNRTSAAFCRDAGSIFPACWAGELWRDGAALGQGVRGAHVRVPLGGGMWRAAFLDVMRVCAWIMAHRRTGESGRILIIDLISSPLILFDGRRRGIAVRGVGISARLQRREG